VGQVLRNTAKSNPQKILQAFTEEVGSPALRLGPLGVFYQNQRVADLDQVIEIISRQEFDAGTVILVPPAHPPMSGKKKAAIVAAIAFVTLTILTYGMFPRCLFQYCD
jgi:hypothetical protein